MVRRGCERSPAPAALLIPPRGPGRGARTGISLTRPPDRHSYSRPTNRLLHSETDMPAETSGNAKQSAPALADLLPVIRYNIEKRTAAPSRGWLNIAIYPAEIALFHVRRGFIFPEAAYHPDGLPVLVQSAACYGQPVRIPVSQVREVSLSHPKVFFRSTGTIRTADRTYNFFVDTRQAKHVEAALRALFGDRLTVKRTSSRAEGAKKTQDLRTHAAPKYSKKQAWTLRLAAIPLGVATAAAIAFAAHQFLTDEGAQAWGLIGGIALGIYVIYLLLNRAYHLGLIPAEQLLAKDSRPPVLYLRSFQDDGKNNLHPISRVADLFGLKNPRAEYKSRTLLLLPVLKLLCLVLRSGKLINLFRGRRTHTAEEQFAAYFNRLGPFIAIGRPGEKLAMGGASRLYVGHDEWQHTVADLLPRCQIILLQPEETEGIWWEIIHIVQKVRPQLVLICLVNYAANQQRYEEFRLKFRAMTNITLPRMIGRCMFVCFGPDWEPKMMELRYYSEFTWPWRGQAVNFARTLRPFLQRQDPAPFSEKDKRFSGLGWLAVTLYALLPVVLFLILALVASLTSH